MIFDIFQLLFALFVSYCLYIAVIIPYQEKKRLENDKINAWLSKLEKG